MMMMMMMMYVVLSLYCDPKLSSNLTHRVPLLCLTHSSLYLSGTTFAHSYLVFQSFLSSILSRTSLSALLGISFSPHWYFPRLTFVPRSSLMQLHLCCLVLYSNLALSLVAPCSYKRLSYHDRTLFVSRSQPARLLVRSSFLNRTPLVSHSHLARILFVLARISPVSQSHQTTQEHNRAFHEICFNEL